MLSNFRSVRQAFVVVWLLSAAADPLLGRAQQTASTVPSSGAGIQRSGDFVFQHHFGDPDLQGRNMGQADLADIDGDGQLDFITGQQHGDIFWYQYRTPGNWIRHPLGRNSPSDVGGAAMDVDRDGRTDFVTGGAWYENPGDPTDSHFIRHVFDDQLNSVHDIVIGDIDDDGRLDVVTMADRRRRESNELRWYSIPDDPTEPWVATTIGEPTHSGISLGDVDADGDTDVVRSNVWFENLGDGRQWGPHMMTPPWGADEPDFAVNATQTETTDVNGDGRLDVVICDGENPNSQIAWLEAPQDPRSGTWRKHPLPRSDDDPRGALHSLKLADFNGDGSIEILAVEMERFPGARPPRWFLWENTDGRGSFVEHVILDANLGGHETVVGDVDADGDIDICSKPWTPNRRNSIGGKSHFSYLENLSAGRRAPDDAKADVLFDGGNLDAWEFAEGSWEVEDEFLTCRMKQGQDQRGRPVQRGMGNIWTKKQYDDFELTLQYKLSVGANSGVFYRADKDNPVQGGFEVQLMDDEGFQRTHGEKDGRKLNGAFYDAQAPSSDPSNPAGQWNMLTLRCEGPRVQISVNGVEVIDVDVDDWDTPQRNPDGTPNKFKTALKDLPRTGRIGLQNHGQQVWFKDIVVRSLEPVQ